MTPLRSLYSNLALRAALLLVVIAAADCLRRHLPEGVDMQRPLLVLVFVTAGYTAWRVTRALRKAHAGRADQETARELIRLALAAAEKDEGLRGVLMDDCSRALLIIFDLPFEERRALLNSKMKEFFPDARPWT